MELILRFFRMRFQVYNPMYEWQFVNVFVSFERLESIILKQVLTEICWKDSFCFVLVTGRKPVLALLLIYSCPTKIMLWAELPTVNVPTSDCMSTVRRWVMQGNPSALFPTSSEELHRIVCLSPEAIGYNMKDYRA